MKFKCFTVCILVLALLSFSIAVHGEDKLLVYCGASFKQPMEEIVKAFTAKTKAEVNVTFGGVGTLLAQIMLTRYGDVFVGPSSYIMEQAKTKGLIMPDSIQTFAYVVPTINVQKGNPKNIANLKDLLKPSAKVALANPEVVFTGMVGVEIINKVLSPEEKKQLKKNIVTYPDDFNKLATILILKQVDAIIGLHQLNQWYPDKVDTIRLKANEIQRIGAGQAAVLSHSKAKPLAEKFNKFLVSAESQEIFSKYHYFATPQQAFDWIGARKPVGGERPATSDWYKE